MMKEKIKILAQTEKKELRKFGLIFAAGAALLFGLFFPWVFDNSISPIPWAIASASLLLSLLLPKLLVFFYVPWMILGETLGHINTRLILGAVFYLIFTPVAFIMKVIKFDPMSRGFRKDLKTYRLPPREKTNVNLERPF